MARPINWLAVLRRVESLRKVIEACVVVAAGLDFIACIAIQAWASSWASAHRAPAPELGDTVLIHVGSRYGAGTDGYVTPTVAHFYYTATGWLIAGLIALLLAIAGLRSWQYFNEDSADALKREAGLGPPDLRERVPDKVPES